MRSISRNNDAATRRVLAVVVSVLAALMVLTGLLLNGGSAVVAATDTSDRRNVHGTVVVPFGVSSEPVSCRLSMDVALAVLGGETAAPCPEGTLGGWSDVHDGTPVRLTDDTGVLLAETELVGGLADGGTVTFSFVVPDVPDAAGYGVEVGRRGVWEQTYAELDEAGWETRLDLR